MNSMERITLSDSISSAISKMVEGNIGAINACISLMKEGKKIDPKNIIGGFDCILELDREGIYGTDIYVFWNDICNQKTPKMIAVLIAVQLGFFSGRVLADACHRQDYSGRSMVPVEELYRKVIERLPEFDLANRQSETKITDKDKMKLTADNVDFIFRDCLFRNDEDTDNAVKAEGIMCKVFFHPERLESHKAKIIEMCDELPDNFKASSGGGWSFLNLCINRSQEQWTGDHRQMEQLMVLGLASGKMQLLTRRELWETLPGGMPYVMVVD